MLLPWSLASPEPPETVSEAFWVADFSESVQRSQYVAYQNWIKIKRTWLDRAGNVVTGLLQAVGALLEGRLLGVWLEGAGDLVGRALAPADTSLAEEVVTP